MTLRTLTHFRNPDLTSDLNHRLRNLVRKGVFFGGQVVPIAGTLDVSIPNFAAMGADGMVTILEGTSETVTCTPGVSQWVLLKSYYVSNDDAVSEFEVLSTFEYDALSTVEQNRRVKLALVTLGAAATEVTTADISFVDADTIDPVDRSVFRGSVASVTNLPDYTDPPTGVTTQNRPHDIYFVESERLFYSWDTTGTPEWSPVISAAEEVALANHKNNQDDGTVPPDFYNAQHITVSQREAFDVGSSSVAVHAADGTAFGSSNGLVDAAMPTGALVRQDVTGVSLATSVQLSGTYYVGTGALGTATEHFRFARYQDAHVLLGTDDNPITVLQINRSDNLFELTPSADADALGYYDDPIVVFDFTATSDSTFSGNLSIYGRQKRTLGTVLPSDEALSNVGLGFTPHASNVPVAGGNFTQISTSTDDVQEALELIDLEITSLTGGASAVVEKIINDSPLTGQNPDTLNWYGGTASILGRLDNDSVNPRVSAVSGDLRFNVTGGNTFDWQNAGSTELSLDPSIPEFSATSGNLAFAVTTGQTHEFSIDGIPRLTLSEFQLDLSNALNVGGSSFLAQGDGVFTSGLCVGFDSVPTSQQVQIGDSDLYLGLDIDIAELVFDATSDVALRYNRTDGNIKFYVAGGLEWELNETRLDCKNNNVTNINSLDASVVEATTRLESSTWENTTPNDFLQWTAGTSLDVWINSVEEAQFTSAGLRILNGLWVGTLGFAPYNDDIVASGGIVCGGVTNPGAGDGIFTRGVSVGFDSTTGDSQRLEIGDAAYYLDLGGSTAVMRFDTSGGLDGMSYNRTTNAWSFQIAGSDIASIHSSGLSVNQAAAPDATLHVHAASSGAYTPTAGTTMVLENDSSNSYFQFVGPDANYFQGIRFGRIGTLGAGTILYRQQANELTLSNGGITRLLIEGAGPMFYGFGVGGVTDASTVKADHNFYLDSGNNHVLFTDSTNSNTNKSAAFTTPSYTGSTTPPVSMMRSFNSSTEQRLYVGGGETGMRSPTSINFSTDTLTPTWTSGDVNMVLNSSGRLIVANNTDDTEADSLVHIRDLLAGVNPATDTLLTLENDDNSYVSFLCDNTDGNQQGLYFGKASDNDIGSLIYRHDSTSGDDTLTVTVDTAVSAVFKPNGMHGSVQLNDDDGVGSAEPVFVWAEVENADVAANQIVQLTSGGTADIQVRPCLSTNNAFTFGVALDSGAAASNDIIRIAVYGIAEVRIGTNTTAVGEYVVADTTAGTAKSESPSTASGNWFSVGRFLEAKTGGSATDTARAFITGPMPMAYNA